MFLQFFLFSSVVWRCKPDAWAFTWNDKKVLVWKLYGQWKRWKSCHFNKRPSIEWNQSRSHTRIPFGEHFYLTFTTDQLTNFRWQIPDLSHSVLSPMSFRLDYRRPGGTSSMFQRNIRLQVDITCATPPSNESSTPSPNFDSTPSLDRPTIYCITFTLLSGQ